MTKKKNQEEFEEELQEEEPAPVKSEKEPPLPITVGVPIATLPEGARFFQNGQPYRKESSGNRIIGTQLIKTPTTGDTWLPGLQQVMAPDTLVEPY